MADGNGHDPDGPARATRVRDVRPTPLDPRWVQMAGMHAEVIHRLDGLVQALKADSRREEALNGRAELVTIEEEYQYNPSTNLIQLSSKTANYFLVEFVSWAIPAGASALIVLGDRQIPVSAQMDTKPFRCLLEPVAVRQMNVSAVGQCFLHLSGRILSPQAWLH